MAFFNFRISHIFSLLISYPVLNLKLTVVSYSLILKKSFREIGQYYFELIIAENRIKCVVRIIIVIFTLEMSYLYRNSAWFLNRVRTNIEEWREPS